MVVFDSISMWMYNMSRTVNDFFSLSNTFFVGLPNDRKTMLLVAADVGEMRE